MNCIVKENDKGEIYLLEISKDDNEFIINTEPLHYKIWKDNYLDKFVEENVEFRISENLIYENTYQLVALPVIHCKQF